MTSRRKQQHQAEQIKSNQIKSEQDKTVHGGFCPNTYNANINTHTTLT
jgi:hypothetical protein